MLRRKGPYEIIVEVLRIASGGSKKTCIRESVGMNYPQFVRYLEALHKSGLLIEEYGLWRTTKKGLIFVVACEKCRSLLNDSNAQRSPLLQILKSNSER
jgi:predicted transcriptional regulator